MRKSSDEKTDKQIQSIERQWYDLERYIEWYNSSVEPSERLVFGDDDIIKEDFPAKKPGRPKFNEMIARIKKRKYDVLLAHEPSRLSRNAYDTWVLTQLLDDKLIQQIQTRSGIYKNNAAEKFTFSLFLNVSKFENDTRAENTKSWMNKRKVDGATTNLANMGYINTGLGKWKRWIDKDWENFTILRTCWERLLTGNYKVSELYQFAIDSWFTRVKNQKNWILREVPTSWAFRKVFSNPYYKWIIVYYEDWTEKESDWNHEPMVTSEEFDKAQIILQKFGFSCSKKNNIEYENLLEGILICWKSGERFTTDIKTRYYCPTEGCGNRFSSATWPKECTKCRQIYPENKYKKDIFRYFRIREAEHMIPWKDKPQKNVPFHYIESEIDKILSRIVITDKLFSVFKRRMYTFWLEEQTKTNKRISKIKKEIETLENKNITIAQNWYSDENATEKSLLMVKEAISDNEQSIREKEAEITKLRDENEEGFEIVWQSLNMLLKAKKLFWKWASESCEPKRDLVISLFANLKFLDWKIIPEWQEPFMVLDKLNILTKQKSQTESEISDFGNLWLPEWDSNLRPTG